jgi:signal transduction histidine kinase/sensor domain CHASE-containing protein
VNEPLDALLVPHERRAFRYLPAILAAASGLCLSLVAADAVRQADSRRIEARFHRDADIRVAALQRSVEHNLEVLEGVAAFYAGSMSVERQEFHEFTRPILAHHTSIQALEWIPRVLDAQRAAFEKGVREDGFPKFEIVQRNGAGGMVRAAKRPVYYPVDYVEPVRGNEAAFGFDLGSDPACLEAMDKARDWGRVAATAPVILVQDTDSRPSCLVLEPIYRNGARTDTLEARRGNLVGFAAAVLRIGVLVEATLNEVEDEPIDVHLYDRLAPPDLRLLHDHFAPRRGEPNHVRGEEGWPVWTNLRVENVLDVGGRQWTVVCGALPEYIAEQGSWSAWQTLGVGLLLTGLLITYLLVSVNRTAKIERLVEYRTAELSLTNRDLKNEVAERKRAEEELQTKQGLLENLLSAHERDRQLIAYEIHDGLVQDATAALLFLQSFQQRQVASSSPVSGEFELGLKMLRDTIGEGRRLIGTLRPPALDEHGLIGGIEALISECSAPTGPAIEFVHDLPTENLSPLLGSMIFRIVQESLTNIRRHARADRARIELTRVEDRVHLEVQDWGVGFDPAHVPGGHFGLQGLRQRVRSLQGEITIESTLGQGTRVVVELPMLTSGRM